MLPFTSPLSLNSPAFVVLTPPGGHNFVVFTPLAEHHIVVLAPLCEHHFVVLIPQPGHNFVASIVGRMSAAETALGPGCLRYMCS